MNHRHSTLAGGLLAAAAVLLLAACGGGDDGPAMPPPQADQVPQSAMVSVEALDSYALAQTATAQDSAEPLKMDRVSMPPTSETAEPIALP